MNTAFPMPGPLYAALRMCQPCGLPDWLEAAAPRCATTETPLRLDEQQAAHLADLAAATWWECRQAEGDGHPLAASFGAVCQEALALLETSVR